MRVFYLNQYSLYGKVVPAQVCAFRNGGVREDEQGQLE